MQALSSVSRHAHWLLRIALASVFLYHGLTKFPQLGGMSEMMGMPVAVLLFVAVAETAGGALILAGGFLSDLVTRLGALLIIPVMLGAIAMVHWPQWAFTPSESHPMGGMEFQVTLTLIALYFLIKGNSANFGAYEPQSR
ncbi:MAG: DoxX family protein [Rubrobacter sp.]|nr:DoxX family protein [Rubrobacter sp.]